ncbi:MAG TPA: hypothetical protein VGF99_10185 [Myxococcota bacterium]
MPVDRRWLVVLAPAALSFVVGAIALPRPQGVLAEQAAFDRSTLTGVTTTPTTPKQPLDVTLARAIQLRGFDGPTAAVSRGGRIDAALHLGVQSVVDGDWQIFVHIDSKDGPAFRINGDHAPLNARYRTGLWQPGEFLVDRFSVVVPVAAPAGVYDVQVGFFRGDKRLPVTGGDRSRADADDRVKVGSIVVE